MRVLPWHDLKEAKSGKYISLRNVVISGQAFEAEPAGIEIVESQKSKVKSQKLIIDGQLYIMYEGKKYNVMGVMME